MSQRVDPDTMLCRAHTVVACSTCMVDDFHDWIREQREKRAQRRRDALTAVSERFDLGGES